MEGGGASLLRSAPMQSVPFKIDEVHGGFTEAGGAVYVDGDDLVFEIETALMGMWNRKTRTYRLDLTDLEDVRHKRTLAGDKLLLRTRPLDLLSVIPGAREGTLTLKVKRKDRRALNALLDRLDLWVERG